MVWAVSAAVAAMLTAEAGAVLHIRAHHLEQVAQQRAADERWVAEVRAAALDVQAARAPIADAANLFQHDAASAVRYDVFVRGAAGADFSVLEERLKAVRAPERRAALHADLSNALVAMAVEVRALAEEGNDDISDEVEKFSAAALRWDKHILALGGDDLPLATTLAGDLPLTKAGRIFRWSSSCGEASEDWISIPDGDEDDTDRLAASVEVQTEKLSTTLDQLMEVPVEQSDVEVQRDLEPALRGLRDAVGAGNDLAAALRAEDREGAAAALVLLDRVTPLFESAARAFEVAGSSVCSDYFDPGLLLEPPAPADESAEA
jgi:hypothetical protein